MKKTSLFVLMVGLTISTGSVFAETGDVTVPSAPQITAVASVTENTQLGTATSVSKLQAKAAQLIKERVAVLNENLKVVTASKTLTSDQKAALTAIINTNLTGLTTLGSSIAASTNASTTKTLTASIFTDFRIFAIVVPQIRLEKRIYDLQNHSTKLSDAFIKIQAKIDEAKGKGKDTSEWQKSLDSSKVLVATDMNTLATLLTKVSALKPVDYGTTSKAVIESVNKDMKNVAKDFNSVIKNVRRPNMQKKMVAASSTPKKAEHESDHR